ncbi:ABC transporter ATP-binding protein [Actinokineospora sp. UTMC 2448]|uniref:ATP-binding cassette domain-containing protein n=1 Tax=Actinokineospora sp. UTMC 2448 TaxID=2268449 RepID=UPI0021644691|nr:ABC transporter ATP-binding protein [Actinokineospora sp. UTMC 2448]UVS78123.1 putative multidrug resistance ABC transporter ATP-binding/permease protein YheH [Actinokineospora sp. UTMC 2448]
MKGGAAAEYWRVLGAQWRGWLVLVACSILEGLPAFLSGALVQAAIDRGFAVGRPLEGITWLGAFGGVAVVGALGARLVWSRLGAVVEPVRDALVGVVVRGVLRDRTGHRVAPDASAVARISQHVEIVRDATAGMLVQARGMVVTAVAAVLGVAVVAGDVVWAVALPVAGAAGAFVVLLPALAKGQRELTLADEATAKVAGEALAGLPDIAACAAYDTAESTVREAARAQARAATRLASASALRVAVVGVGAFLPVVLVLATAPPTMSGAALLGVLVYLTGSLYPALNGLAATTSTVILRLIVALRRLAEAASTDDHEPGTERPDTTEITVRGLTHRWGEHAEPVLADFDIDLRPGDHLCVVGPSGIGKSTLAALLTGLLPVQHGTVEIGGVPVERIDPALIAFTPQEAYVFAGTVRENIALLNPDAPDERLAQAAREVGAAHLDLDADASALDPADRQLIALARVHATDAPIVVLDEATSHLTARQEAAAERAIADRGGILVVIAHRMSSAERASRVLLLDGRHTLLGAHADLARRSEQYAGLVNAWSG